MDFGSRMNNLPLAGRSAVVTGAAGGFGRAVARAFWQNGASLFLTSRSEARLRLLHDELVSDALSSDQEVRIGAFDLLLPGSIDALVESIRASIGIPTILVNNAAVQGPIGPLWENDSQRWRRTLETNLVVPAELCAHVIPMMKNTHYGKIINMSGGGATGPRPNFSAYAASKAALVRLTEVIAAETDGTGIDCNAIAPGAMNTSMLDEVLSAGEAQVGRVEYTKARQQLEKGGTPPQRGAALAVYLAAAMSDGISGRLLSAVWDPWDRLPDLRKRLDDSDIYTLRRIVPRDRQLDWGD